MDVKIKKEIEISLNEDDFIKAFVDGNDKTQGSLFNLIGKRLKHTGWTNWQRHTQLCHAAQGLDEDGIYLIKALAEFIRINEEDEQ